jgi:hypothetical protein
LNQFIAKFKNFFSNAVEERCDFFGRLAAVLFEGFCGQRESFVRLSRRGFMNHR